jgi:hypothetical protein
MYESAFGTGAIENVAGVAVPLIAQILAVPIIAAGIAGVALVTDIERLIVLLQPLIDTETDPLVNEEANLNETVLVP